MNFDKMKVSKVNAKTALHLGELAGGRQGCFQLLDVIVSTKDEVSTSFIFKTSMLFQVPLPIHEAI